MESNVHNIEHCSYVTVIPSSIVSRQSILRTAFLIAVLSYQTETIISIKIHSKDGEYKIPKDQVKTQLGSMKKAYNEIASALAIKAKTGSSDNAEAELLEYKLHKSLGIAIRAAVNDLTTIEHEKIKHLVTRETLKKIAVIPSIEQMLDLFGSVFIIREVEKNLNITVERTE
ncbi:hypothetical protein V6259_12470 [Marinomonas sp. TI.3.20]|uniref:hypothetical protein n=1 Tax=Marinomonas sp. TI.3.20 TaxID=3121296 RepID=UPI003120282A